MQFTHAARDEAAILRSEIKHDNGLATFPGLYSVFPLTARTASDVNNLPAQETGILGSKEGDHVGDVAWFSNAAHRNGFRRLLDHNIGVISLAARGRTRHFGIDK